MITMEMADQDALDLGGRHTRSFERRAGMAEGVAPGGACPGIDEGDPRIVLQQETVHIDADGGFAPACDSLLSRLVASCMDQDIRRGLENAIVQDGDIVAPETP
jgi:hypothetical protein